MRTRGKVERLVLPVIDVVMIVSSANGGHENMQLVCLFVVEKPYEAPREAEKAESVGLKSEDEPN